MKIQWYSFVPLIVLVVANCSVDDEMPNEGQPTNVAVSSSVFAIIGDFGEDGDPELQVSEMVKSWHPDFIISTGDNNYPKGELATIRENIEKYYADFIYNPDAPLEYRCSGRAANDQTNYFFPCPGNHDYGDSTSISPYLSYFTLPGTERNYEFTWGGVHFFSIDSGKYGVETAQEVKDWLQQKVEGSPLPFKLVYFHYPPFSSGDHGNSPAMQWSFTDWGVSAVISGHNHTYEHTIKSAEPGLHYFVNGFGGRAPLYQCSSNPLDTNAFSTFCYDENFGAIKVTYAPGKITFSAFSIENGGTLIDEVVLLK